MTTLKATACGRCSVLAVAAGGSAVAGAAGLAEPAGEGGGPFGAGGAADRLGRIAADHLSKAFKQQFYIENRVGAGGAVAATDVARADADGYTLLVGGSGPHVMGPAKIPTSATTRSAISPTSR